MFLNNLRDLSSRKTYWFEHLYAKSISPTPYTIISQAASSTDIQTVFKFSSSSTCCLYSVDSEKEMKIADSEGGSISVPGSFCLINAAHPPQLKQKAVTRYYTLHYKRASDWGFDFTVKVNDFSSISFLFLQNLELKDPRWHQRRITRTHLNYISME